MADFIFVRKSRNILSSILHVVLNIALGAGSVLITMATKSPFLGILLVVLSKWRMFAVRPRYWWLNIKSNLVDLIVGIAFVLISYCTGTIFLPVHVITAVLYSFWLVFLKPRSTEFATNFQALWAVFFGTIALTMMTASADPIFMVAGCFIIGYAAARHVLIQGDDNNFNIIMLAGGLIAAEIAWLCRSWLIVYSFSDLGIIIPQLSIILSIFAYTFGYVYHSITANEGKLKWNEVGMPTIFAILLISIIVVWFSQPIFNV